MFPNELTDVFIGTLGFLFMAILIQGRNTNLTHILYSFCAGACFGIYTWVGFAAVALAYIIPIIILALHRKWNK